MPGIIQDNTGVSSNGTVRAAQASGGSHSPQEASLPELLQVWVPRCARSCWIEVLWGGRRGEGRCDVRVGIVKPQPGGQGTGGLAQLWGHPQAPQAPLKTTPGPPATFLRAGAHKEQNRWPGRKWSWWEGQAAAPSAQHPHPAPSTTA